MDSARGEPTGDADHPGVLFAGAGAVGQHERRTLRVSSGVLAHRPIVGRPTLANMTSINVDLVM